MAGSYLLLLLAGAAMLYRYRPIFTKPPVVGHSLRGLGGWLILPIAGLITTPFWDAYLIASNTAVFTVEDWQNLTLSGSSNYHPLWGAVLTLELLGNLTMLVFALLLAVLFFQKRRTFPYLYIAFQAVSILLAVADSIGCSFIPSVTASAGTQTAPPPFCAILGSVIWIAYMQTSARVKATFVK